MSEREIDGFQVWSSARQEGDEGAHPMVCVKALDGSTKTRFLTVITDKNFRTLDAAMEASHAVVDAIVSVDSKGVPHPLTY